MNLNKEDVHLFDRLAKAHYLDDAANYEYPNGKPLESGDFRSICLLKAALSVFKKMGVVEEKVTLDLKEPFVEDFAE